MIKDYKTIVWKKTLAFMVFGVMCIGILTVIFSGDPHSSELFGWIVPAFAVLMVVLLIATVVRTLINIKKFNVFLNSLSPKDRETLDLEYTNGQKLGCVTLTGNYMIVCAQFQLSAIPYSDIKNIIPTQHTFTILHLIPICRLYSVCIEFKGKGKISFDLRKKEFNRGLIDFTSKILEYNSDIKINGNSGKSLEEV